MSTDAIKKREFFNAYKGKIVHIIRKNSNMHYNGLVIDILDNQLVLDDDKVGQIILNFDDISIELKREQ